MKTNPMMWKCTFQLFQYENLDFQIFGIIPLAFPIFPLYTGNGDDEAPISRQEVGCDHFSCEMSQ